METDFNMARMKASLEIADLVRLTVKAVFIEQGKEKTKLNQNQAWEKYTQVEVERWVRLGLIVGNKTGLAKNSPVKYDALDLEALDMASNRRTYVAQVREQEQQTKTP